MSCRPGRLDNNMIQTNIVQTLKRHLFAGPGSVFTILDGASVPDLPANLTAFNPEYLCLYRGELEPDMAEVAPYLAILEQDSPFTDWVLASGWGKHWGIFGTAQADLPTLRKHFRSFVIVYDESGKSLVFRFYDPRIWRSYLPTCNGTELTTVFGPVLSYLVEDDKTDSASKFFYSNAVLQEEKLSLGDARVLFGPSADQIWAAPR
jgi:hypothetical protein